jgi:hypothetical protein
MRKRDKLFALWASAPPLQGLTQAVRFTLEEPLLEATRDERDELEQSWAVVSTRAAREALHLYSPLQDASMLHREDALVRIATKVAVEVLAGFGLVMLWEWVTQRDARVCDRCGPLDGKIMQSHLIAPLPLHPRCRCGLRPVFQTVSLPALTA